MIPDTKCDATRLVKRLEAIGPNVRQALADALLPVAISITADARARARQHIHYLGAKNPGSYLASITGGVSTKRQNKVTGYVRSGHPLAHLLEYGASTPAHDIAVSAAKAMHFTGCAGEVFARLVHSPGATIPAYPAIVPALEAARGGVEAAMVETVTSSASKAGQ